MASSEQVVEKRRYYSVEEANKTLPLVRAIMEDIVRQNRIVEELQDRIASVKRDRRRPPRGQDSYSEELSQTQAELELREDELRAFILELQKLGVEFKGFDGLCDFYTMVDGREAYLCWRLDEPEILYWHELESGFQGRQPVSSLKNAKTHARRMDPDSRN
jgi:hypothetical protein